MLLQTEKNKQKKQPAVTEAKVCKHNNNILSPFNCPLQETVAYLHSRQIMNNTSIYDNDHDFDFLLAADLIANADCVITSWYEMKLIDTV